MLPLWPVVGGGGGRREVRPFCFRLDKEKREVTALVWGHKKRDRKDAEDSVRDRSM